MTSHTDRWHLHVSVDVQPVVFGGQNNGTVIHKADVEALGMFNFRFECGQQLAILRKHRQVEVVMVVGNDNLTGCVDANTNRIISDTYRKKKKKTSKRYDFYRQCIGVAQVF